MGENAVEGATDVLNTLIEHDVFLGILLVLLLIIVTVIIIFVWLQSKHYKATLEEVKEAFAETQKILVSENHSLREYNLKLLEQLNAPIKKK